MVAEVGKVKSCVKRVFLAIHIELSGTKAATWPNIAA